jgi:hypothetical protein
MADKVEGSVLEFAFGTNPNSYFATSYPYRAENALREDVRCWEWYVFDIRQIQASVSLNRQPAKSNDDSTDMSQPEYAPVARERTRQY